MLCFFVLWSLSHTLKIQLSFHFMKASERFMCTSLPVCQFAVNPHTHLFSYSSFLNLNLYLYLFHTFGRELASSQTIHQTNSNCSFLIHKKSDQLLLMQYLSNIVNCICPERLRVFFTQIQFWQWVGQFTDNPQNYFLLFFFRIDLSLNK